MAIRYRITMTTFPNRYACTADDLALAAEALDYRANTARAPRGRFELAVLQLLTGAAVLLARRVEVLNR